MLVLGFRSSRFFFGLILYGSDWKFGCCTFQFFDGLLYSTLNCLMFCIQRSRADEKLSVNSLEPLS